MLHLYQDTPILGGDALYAMSDVNINNPEDGQMLVYDASTQRWRNVTQKSLNDLAEVTDLTNVIATGSTNATGATIPKGLYFYLNDELCQAKVDIANGATFTLNTNYEVVTAGGLNSLNSAIADMLTLDYANQVELKDTLNQTGRTYTVPKTGLIRCVATNTANGDGYYVLRTNRSVNNAYQRDIVFVRNDVIAQGIFNEALVNKGETIVVDTMSNKTVNTCLFIPFKGSI